MFYQTKQVLHIRQDLLGLVKHSRTTDLWLWILVISGHNGKLEITMKISKLLLGLAEYSAIRVEGVNHTALLT
jgi:hypothetical protein